MTHPPEDQPTMWFKQVPLNNRHAEGVWSQSLLEGHVTVQRSHERPVATVDAVTLQELKVAARAVSMRHGDQLADPVYKRLHDALLGM